MLRIRIEVHHGGNSGISYPIEIIDIGNISPTSVEEEHPGGERKYVVIRRDLSVDDTFSWKPLKVDAVVKHKRSDGALVLVHKVIEELLRKNVPNHAL